MLLLLFFSNMRQPFVPFCLAAQLAAAAAHRTFSTLLLLSC
jgi:hypothetical protein